MTSYYSSLNKRDVFFFMLKKNRNILILLNIILFLVIIMISVYVIITQNVKIIVVLFSMLFCFIILSLAFTIIFLQGSLKDTSIILFQWEKYNFYSITIDKKKIKIEFHVPSQRIVTLVDHLDYLGESFHEITNKIDIRNIECIYKFNNKFPKGTIHLHPRYIKDEDTLIIKLKNKQYINPWPTITMNEQHGRYISIDVNNKSDFIEEISNYQNEKDNKRNEKLEIKSITEKEERRSIIESYKSRKRKEIPMNFNIFNILFGLVGFIVFIGGINLILDNDFNGGIQYTILGSLMMIVIIVYQIHFFFNNRNK